MPCKYNFLVKLNFKRYLTCRCEVGGERTGEEEFYYTELEVSVEAVTRGIHDMCSSPPSPGDHGNSGSLHGNTGGSHGNTTTAAPTVIPDHDYQKKVGCLG